MCTSCKSIFINIVQYILHQFNVYISVLNGLLFKSTTIMIKVAKIPHSCLCVLEEICYKIIQYQNKHYEASQSYPTPPLTRLCNN